MQALLQPEYGTADVLVLEEIDKPTVGDDEVLVRVHAASVNFGDKMTLLGLPKVFRLLAFGLSRPRNRVAGMAAAGVVEAVGSKVAHFAPGDEVFGELTRGGGCAEYVVAQPGAIAHKPAGVSFEQAAAIPIGGTTALAGLRDAGGVRPGHKVLINGASGGVGTFAVQIARTLGAEVTAVCSAGNVEQARLHGATKVIDYTQQDYTTREARFDVVFDLVGNHTLSERLGVLEPDGVYVASFGQGGGRWFGPLARIFLVAIASLFRPNRIKVLTVSPSEADLLEVARLVEAGEVVPFIERTYPLAQARDAFRHLLQGHARGKLVIAVRSGP